MTARSSNVATFAFAAALVLGADLAPAQSVIGRTPNVTGAWVGTPGALVLDASVRYTSFGGELGSLPTIGLAYGLPINLLPGLNFAVSSPVDPGLGTEVEPYLRWAPVVEKADNPLQVALQLGFNTAVSSVDGEVEAAYRVGSARLLGALRGFTDGFDEGPVVAPVAGIVFQPFARVVPLALAGDLGAAFGSDRGEVIVWSAGVQVGLPITPSTLSLQVTNASSMTLQGRSFGTSRVRLGAQVTLVSPVGALFGVFVPREIAARSVHAVQPVPEKVVRVAIRDFAFVGERLEVAAGTTIEWTNYDRMVHTATSDDAAWNSGAIPPGESWSARFDEPGVYSYHCGPHPYMRGSIVVR